jgi:methyl-accepting chemotaxis protein
MAILWVLITKILKPSKDIVKYLTEMAKGNLGVKINSINSKDEFAEIVEQIKLTSSSLDEMVKDINKSSIEVYQASTESKNRIESLKGNIDDISISTEQLSSSMEETAAITEQINAISEELKDFATNIFSGAEGTNKNNQKIIQLSGELKTKLKGLSTAPKGVMKDILDYADEIQNLTMSTDKMADDAKKLFESIENTVKGISEVSISNTYSANEITEIAKSTSKILQDSNKVLSFAEKTRKCSFSLMGAVDKFTFQDK